MVELRNNLDELQSLKHQAHERAWAHELLQIAREETPNAESRTKTLAALALGGATGLAATKAAAATASHFASVAPKAALLAAPPAGATLAAGGSTAAGSSAIAGSFTAAGGAAAIVKTLAAKSGTLLLSKWAGAAAISAVAVATTVQVVTPAASWQAQPKVPQQEALWVDPSPAADSKPASTKRPLKKQQVKDAPLVSPVEQQGAQSSANPSESAPTPRHEYTPAPARERAKSAPAVVRGPREIATRNQEAGPSQEASPSINGTLKPIDASELRVELTLIESARSALATGGSSRALKLLTEHRARFPRGHLVPEASYLRMRAYASAGQQQAAKRHARHIIKHYPSGPHAGKAREVLQQ